ncbi:hypothetical protein AAAX36_09390, partial [Collinsella sp. CLA-ER-H10]|uniref:hypothetical protein n=1 Tax=Collinsella sp. CLA-ER-H10 TaxID=3136218 RepID=UPI0032BF2CA0
SRREYCGVSPWEARAPLTGGRHRAVIQDGEGGGLAASPFFALIAAFTKQLNQSNHPPVNINVHRSVAGSLFSMD